MTGRLLRADEALSWGLVSRVVPDGELVDEACVLTRDVIKKSPLAVANAKRTLNTVFWEGASVAAGLRLEREVTARYCITSADAPEGLEAFFEKRTPQWSGR